MPEPENIGLKIIFLQLNATYRIIKVVHPQTKDISRFCALEDEQTEEEQNNNNKIQHWTEFRCECIKCY